MYKNISLVKVTKPAVNYFCRDTEFGTEGKFNLGIAMNKEQIKDNLYEVFFMFKFGVMKDSSSFIKEEEELHELENFNLMFDVTYKAILSTSLEENEIDKGVMLNVLRSYITKDLLDYFREIESPTISLPEQIWSEPFE